MYRGKRILVTICARGGSKGIPGKNIKMLAGKPLLAYTIASARQCSFVDRIVLSTDDVEIRKVGEKLGLEVPFLRSKELATDKSGRVAAVVDAVQRAEKYWKETYDIVVDLGNTAPFRQPRDIDACIKKLVNTPETNLVFTVSESRRNPYFNMVEVDKDGNAHLAKKIRTLLRRQDAPAVYDMNDAVFAVWKNILLKYKSFIIPKRKIHVMPQERSVDIDSVFDWNTAECMIMHKNGEKAL